MSNFIDVKLNIRAAFFAGIFSLTLLAAVSLVSLGSAGIGGAVVGGISIGLVLSLSAYLYRILLSQPQNQKDEKQ